MNGPSLLMGFADTCNGKSLQRRGQIPRINTALATRWIAEDLGRGGYPPSSRR
jgi:hypothetical protein